VRPTEQDTDSPIGNGPATLFQERCHNIFTLVTLQSNYQSVVHKTGQKNDKSVGHQRTPFRDLLGYHPRKIHRSRMIDRPRSHQHNKCSCRRQHQWFGKGIAYMRDVARVFSCSWSPDQVLAIAKADYPAGVGNTDQYDGKWSSLQLAPFRDSHCVRQH
jgi:hypothetical protein